MKAVRSVILLTLGGATSVLAQGGSPGADDVASLQIPDAVRSALEENAAALSPLSVKWEMNYETDLPLDEALATGKFIEGRYFFEPTSVDLQRDGVRFSCRRRTWRESPDGIRQETEFFYKFDGVDYYMLKDDPAALSLVMVYPWEDLKNSQGFTCSLEYLERCGFQRFDTQNHLQDPDESLVLYQLGRGLRLARAEAQQREGRSEFLVELFNSVYTHRFYLDASMRYAVRSYEILTRDGEPIRSTVNEDFVAFVDPPIWLPRRSRTAWHRWPPMGAEHTAEPLVYEEIVTTELNKEPLSDEHFAPDLRTPLLAVADGRLPGAEKQPDGLVQYQVPADLEHLDGVIEAAIAGREYEPPLTTHRTRFALIAVNVLILAVAAVWFWRRRS